jgi:hypothetical protein
MIRVKQKSVAILRISEQREVADMREKCSPLRNRGVTHARNISCLPRRLRQRTLDYLRIMKNATSFLLFISFAETSFKLDFMNTS